MTDFINTIDTWPKAIVAAVMVAAVAWVTVVFIKMLFGD